MATKLASLLPGSPLSVVSFTCCLHLFQFNMAAADFWKTHSCPGRKVWSKVWDYFECYQAKEGPAAGYNRGLINWSNPIISDDRLCNHCQHK